MKINYKNTALGLIDDPSNFYFGFPDPHITPLLCPGELLTFAHTIRNNSSLLKELCGNNIQYVTKPFWEAYAKGRHKLASIFDKEEIEEGGVIILPGTGITHTYYYYVRTYWIDDVWTYDCLFMDFNKRNTKEHEDGPALDVYTSTTLEKEDDKYISRKSMVWNGYMEEGRDAKWWEAMILTFVLFKKYCDIETKVIEPNRKGIVAGSKYVNETKKRITVLDSTWFVNLVVSGAFEVGGHLHWYLTGPNKSIRRLQWVNTYEKDGYIRKAKAINQ